MMTTAQRWDEDEDKTSVEVQAIGSSCWDDVPTLRLARAPLQRRTEDRGRVSFVDSTGSRVEIQVNAWSGSVDMTK